MKVAASPKLVAYVALAAVGFLAAVLVGEPDLAALALPFAAIAAFGLALARHPSVAVEVGLDRERVLAGEQVTLEVVLEADAPVAGEFVLHLEPGLALTEDRVGQDLWLQANERTPRSLTVRCERWGLYRPARIELRATDELGLFFYRQFVERALELRVYPHPEQVRALVPPRDTQALTGDLVSRAKGEGLEFADIREYTTGDRVKRVNWNVSARRGTLHVNQYLPERNAEVILFLDAFTDLGHEGASTLDRAVAATATLAELHLRRRDRVGLICYGGVLNWLTPATGVRQLYRVIDALLDARTLDSAIRPEVSVLPRKMLPPRALILAFSALLDERSIGALLELRSRGTDLVIIEVPPQAVSAGESESEQLALRLWKLRRRSLRALCQSTGALVVQWPQHAPLAAATELAKEWRRVPQRLSA